MLYDKQKMPMNASSELAHTPGKLSQEIHTLLSGLEEVRNQQIDIRNFLLRLCSAPVDDKTLKDLNREDASDLFGKIMNGNSILFLILDENKRIIEFLKNTI